MLTAAVAAIFDKLEIVLLETTQGNPVVAEL
jgi:hypothetical protein